MARSDGSAEGSRKRERLATLLLVLFPLFAMSGFFAPGFLRYLAQAETEEPAERAEVVDRLGPFAHRPLLVPRDFSEGYVPELLDMDELFHKRRNYRLDLKKKKGEPQQVVIVSSFDRFFGDSIVQNSVGEIIAQVVFKDALMDELPRTVQALFDIEGNSLGLCDTLSAANCFRDDDLTNTSAAVNVPVPEPGAVTLLALGILGLAICARRY